MRGDLGEAFYLPEGEGTFVATPSTRGPWDVRMQHGGPPSALMARAVDRAIGDEHAAWVPARTLIEILRPVPIARIEVAAAIESRGRQAIRARAALSHEGVEIARLRAILIRGTEPDEALVRASEEPPFPPPDAWPGYVFDFFPAPVGYHTSMELRTLDAWPSSRMRSWARMRVPLVAGEEPSGWQRALVFADAAHGTAPALDPKRHSLVNPDLELSLLRRPVGEWIGLDVRTTTSAIGTGLTRSRVLDAEGECGATSATLVVRART